MRGVRSLKSQEVLEVFLQEPLGSNSRRSGLVQHPKPSKFSPTIPAPTSSQKLMVCVYVHTHTYIYIYIYVCVCVLQLPLYY